MGWFHLGSKNYSKRASGGVVSSDGVRYRPWSSSDVWRCYLALGRLRLDPGNGANESALALWSGDGLRFRPQPNRPVRRTEYRRHLVLEWIRLDAANNPKQPSRAICKRHGV